MKKHLYAILMQPLIVTTCIMGAISSKQTAPIDALSTQKELAQTLDLSTQPEAPQKKINRFKTLFAKKQSKKSGPKKIQTKKSFSLSGLLKSEKRITDMTYEELAAAQARYGASKNHDSFIKVTELMLKLCEDAAKLPAHMLELADALFELKKFDKSQPLYAEFNRLYPRHDRSTYALSRAVTSASNRLLSIDRDQTPTREALELAKEFLANANNLEYRDEIEKIANNCYTQLIQSELNVCQYYLTIKSPTPAEKRVADVRATLISHAPHLTASVEAVEQRIADTCEYLEHKRIAARIAADKAEQKQHKLMAKREKKAHHKNTELTKAA